MIKSYLSGKRTNDMPKITVIMSLSHNNMYINHNENIIIFFSKSQIKCFFFQSIVKSQYYHQYILYNIIYDNMDI